MAKTLSVEVCAKWSDLGLILVNLRDEAVIYAG